MQSFSVSFHQEDHVDAMLVQKLSEDDFEKATEGGTRHLFELDTNIGLFVFFDGADKDGAISYMILHYEEGNEDPAGCYAFQLSDFYEFMALFLQDLNYQEETEEDEAEYGPIHHLAHLIFHVVDAGRDIEV
ncbi:cytosolic protein [Neobacillus muris]|uniref:cytosolic protein n=1 Tax=Neobacillus muris TaxID=2941334 RepID=UPI00203E28F6|nr:cytosolic protein [Neobacillus muris]